MLSLSHCLAFVLSAFLLNYNSFFIHQDVEFVNKIIDLGFYARNVGAAGIDEDGTGAFGDGGFLGVGSRWNRDAFHVLRYESDESATDDRTDISIISPDGNRGLNILLTLEGSRGDVRAERAQLPKKMD